MSASEKFFWIALVGLDVLLFSFGGTWGFWLAVVVTGVSFLVSFLLSDWAKRRIWRPLVARRMWAFPRFHKGVYVYRRKKDDGYLRFRYGGGHGFAFGERGKREALPVGGQLYRTAVATINVRGNYVALYDDKQRIRCIIIPEVIVTSRADHNLSFDFDLVLESPDGEKGWQRLLEAIGCAHGPWESSFQHPGHPHVQPWLPVPLNLPPWECRSGYIAFAVHPMNLPAKGIESPAYMKLYVNDTSEGVVIAQVHVGHLNPPELTSIADHTFDGPPTDMSVEMRDGRDGEKTKLMVSPDGNRFLSMSPDGTIRERHTGGPTVPAKRRVQLKGYEGLSPQEIERRSKPSVIARIRQLFGWRNVSTDDAASIAEALKEIKEKSEQPKPPESQS